MTDAIKNDPELIERMWNRAVSGRGADARVSPDELRALVEAVRADGVTELELEYAHELVQVLTSNLQRMGDGGARGDIDLMRHYVAQAESILSSLNASPAVSSGEAEQAIVAEAAAIERRAPEDAADVRERVEFVVDRMRREGWQMPRLSLHGLARWLNVGLIDYAVTDRDARDAAAKITGAGANTQAVVLGVVDAGAKYLNRLFCEIDVRKDFEVLPELVLAMVNHLDEAGARRVLGSLSGDALRRVRMGAGSLDEIGKARFTELFGTSPLAVAPMGGLPFGM